MVVISFVALLEGCFRVVRGDARWATRIAANQEPVPPDVVRHPISGSYFERERSASLARKLQDHKMALVHLLATFDETFPDLSESWESEANRVIRDVERVAEELPSKLRVTLSMARDDHTPLRLMKQTLKKTYNKARALVAGIDRILPDLVDDPPR
jgi:hypothetical protein